MKPYVTLFMLSSVDGKISTGDGDSLDFDKDLPNIGGDASKGLYQYYDIEQTTDLWSLNSGRVMNKMGVNKKPIPKERMIVSFVILDNNHLTKRGVQYLCAMGKEVVLVTSNTKHPAFSIKENNLDILYQRSLDLNRMLHYLYSEHRCERLTVQSGGTINSLFFRDHLFDAVDIVISPILVGGKNTPSVIDGNGITNTSELKSIEKLKLKSVDVLKDSYVRMRYERQS